MTLKELRDSCFYADNYALAKACGVNVTLIRKWLHENREVLKLADGGWILTSKRSVIIKNGA